MNSQDFFRQVGSLSPALKVSLAPHKAAVDEILSSILSNTLLQVGGVAGRQAQEIGDKINQALPPEVRGIVDFSFLLDIAFKEILALIQDLIAPPVEVEGGKQGIFIHEKKS